MANIDSAVRANGPGDGSFLSRLERMCEKNGYLLQDSSASDPQVVIIADYHPQNVVWFADNIEAILLGSLQRGDVILMEGAEGKVIYSHFRIPESPIFYLCPTLESRGVTSIFNDSFDLMQRHKIVRKVLDQTYDAGTLKRNQDASDEDKLIRELRDKYFIDGPFGITKHSGRKFQVVGASHIANIVARLKERDLTYAVIGPSMPPSEESKKRYVLALNSLSVGDVKSKVSAIQKIHNVPIRRTQFVLYSALNDKSGRVRKYAAQALGQIGNQRCIPYLIRHLDDEDMLTRWTVGRALARFDDKKIEDLVSGYLSSRDRNKWTTAALLQYEGHNVSSLVYDGLDVEDPFIRALAIRLIGKTGNVDVKRIANYFSDEHPAVREEAVRVVSSVNPELAAQHDWSHETDRHVTDFVQRANQNGTAVRMRQNADKVRGSLYGVIVGDALGAPIEGLSLDQIRKRYGIVRDYVSHDFRRDPGVVGSYTDDGELTLEMMKSISAVKSVNPYDIAQQFSEVARVIDEDFSKNRGYGMSLMAFRKLYAGVNWRFSGNNTPGCGAAMRVAAISALDKDTRQDLIDQAQITHTDPVAIAGAVAIGYATSRAYDLGQGFDRLAFIDEVAESAHAISPQLAQEVRYLKDMLDKHPDEVLPLLPISDVEPKRKGKLALGTVPAALYCFLRTPADFEQTVVSAVNNSGDSDSIGAMAGGISGAYNGYKAIPERFVRGLHERDKIEDAVQRFLSIK